MQTVPSEVSTLRDPYEMRPLEAWRALRVLLSNPEETEHVFTIVRALSGKSTLRGYNRFAATPQGETILNERRQLIQCLQDREALRSLPEGSLGRAYLDFVEQESISADGLVEASDGTDDQPDPNIRFYSERLRDMHDLWHVLTGYGRDVMGEACLLGFTVAQSWNPGIALITLAGSLKIARESTPKILSAVWRAYRAGRRAAWLPSADWEQLLALPIEDVRRQLGIQPPELYPEILDQLAA